MARKQDEEPRASEPNERGKSAQPPNAAEALPPQAPQRKPGKRSRKAVKGARKDPHGQKEEVLASEAAAKKPAQPEKPAETRTAGPIKPGLRKRVRLAEALRREGLDERAVAESYVIVVEKLRNGNAAAAAAQKALVDVLKECSRILEPPRATGAGAGDMPAVVNLYHNVPRPVRDLRREHGEAEPV
jgi:hypothetical protein